jgi:hypothetical protein
MTSLRRALARIPRPNALTFYGMSDKETLDAAASAAEREQPKFRRTSTPLYDQTRDTWGIDPSATATVDEMLRELDLLALPIVTGTLRGPVEGGAA